MIKGIGGIPIIELDQFLDIETLKNLHFELCYGIAKSEFKKIGNIVKPGGCDAYTPPFKPIGWALDEYYALPDDHEIKVYGEKLGGIKNRNQFVQYIKLALGGYDPYEFVFLKTEDGGWETRFDEKAWTPDAQHFPNFKKWCQSLVDNNILQHLGRIIIFRAEHDVLPPKHRDLILPNETDYFPHRHEHIWLRSTLDKKFFVWDPGVDNYHYVKGYTAFFNDQDWHGAEAANKQTFSVRIDGPFTEEFRKKLNIDHLGQY
jgi:hypothetical protein